MKKGILLLICMTLLLSLCACGPQPGETVPTTDATTPNQSTQTDPTQTDPTQQTETKPNMVELVRKYIDKPVEELYKVIGKPISSDYASSCLGSGEDGLLIYDGFVVYTYREGNSEVVYDVE